MNENSKINVSDFSKTVEPNKSKSTPKKKNPDVDAVALRVNLNDLTRDTAEREERSRPLLDKLTDGYKVISVFQRQGNNSVDFILVKQ